ncbi:threonine/serine exporter family protein [Acuticoccus kandeliae]|uniref:threonine/serine exporter family protein n=1 Tax=Acuticoccus kandeliae TaxID=2073160 RepID=UPI0014741EA5|nr:threonine/serine exporter family protein [Acuticoccus kandeliae]
MPATDPATPQDEEAAAWARLPVLAHAAALLIENGQTTERTVLAVEGLATVTGTPVRVYVRWGEVRVEAHAAGRTQMRSVTAAPLGVHMGKVAETMEAIEAVRAGSLSVDALGARLDRIAAMPPVSTPRFALFAAIGAAALAILFGASEPATILLAMASAGGGAVLRRIVARRTANPFAQPLVAALLAGLAGGVALSRGLATEARLVMLCPCMVLVPGPHFLNGFIDLLRARISLGIARVALAGMIVVAISAGLLAGLAATGSTLPSAGSPPPLAFTLDIIAAGLAVSAYGTFFSMPWRYLPIPILIGMMAHASRWAALVLAGASLEVGALVACLIAGLLVTPISRVLRLPFAAFAFAAVVSLIPGIFLFEMAAATVALLHAGEAGAGSLLLPIATNGAAALLILLAMTIGVIVPKMIIDAIWPFADDAPLRDR